MTALYALAACCAVYLVGRAAVGLIEFFVNKLVDWFIPPPRD